MKSVQKIYKNYNLNILEYNKIIFGKIFYEISLKIELKKTSNDRHRIVTIRKKKKIRPRWLTGEYTFFYINSLMLFC